MQARTDNFRAGMPHLDIFGLSEQFCLSHSGNLHWSWISEFTGRLPSKWQCGSGKRVYANFIYTSLTYNRNISVGEDDEVTVSCKPLAVRAPFVITETIFSKEGAGVIACALLMSTFSSTDGSSNHRFIKSSIPFNVPAFGAELLEETRNRFRELRDRKDDDLTKASDHLVNPSVDFNAAEFMYFANFSQLLKRYESPRLSAEAPLFLREVAYLGNVDPFEWTTIASQRDGLKVNASITRSSGNKCIARSYSKCVSLADPLVLPQPEPQFVPAFADREAAA